MRIIIAGSREFKNYSLLECSVLKTVNELKELGYCTERDSVEIVSGTAYGADRLGELFAFNYGLKVVRFPANWDIGKKAGYLRNSEMSKYAKEDEEIGVLIAFWNRKSRGTKHMIDLATKDGLKVYIINF